MAELVVDTNVFVHAANQRLTWHAPAIRLVQTILKSKTVWLCVDKPNANVPDVAYYGGIVQEYFAKLNGSMWFWYELLDVFQTRTRDVDCTLPSRDNKWIIQNVHNKRDRTFLRVAVNTRDHVLVSHDFSDFDDKGTTGVRARVRTRFKVDIIDAATCKARLKA